MHATIFDPPPPRPTRPEAETEPEVVEYVRRRETEDVSPWLNDGSVGTSSWAFGGAESVAIGGSSVCTDGLRDPLGAP